MTAALILGLILGAVVAGGAVSMATARWHEGYLAAEAYREELGAVEKRLAQSQADYERLRKDRGYTDGYRAPGRPS